MSEEIKPALMPDEWRSRDFNGAIIDFPHLVSDLYAGDFAGEMAPAIMALANDSLPADSPYKITRGDVRRLYSIAGALERPDCPTAGRPLAQLAAKLTALLPPESP